MSKLGMLLGVAAMMSAMSESNYTQKQNYKMKAPIDEWNLQYAIWRFEKGDYVETNLNEITIPEEKLKEPRKEDYGYQDGGFEEESGWLLEGGEEAYQEAYDRYMSMLNKQKQNKNA